MRKLFMFVGMVLAFLLCVYDFKTNVDGFRAVVNDAEGDLWMQSLPFVMAGMALCMNALASYMGPVVEESIRNGEETPLAAAGFRIVFVMFIAFDCVSSLIGFLMMFTRSTGILEAMEKATTINWIGAFMAALPVTISPFLLMVMYKLYQKEGGLSGNF